MNTNYYFIHEVRNVLFAHKISSRLAALQFSRPGSVALSSPEELWNLAAHRNKYLHLTDSSVPQYRRRAREAEPIPA